MPKGQFHISIPAMKPKILLVNPPIYDFSAYDFWLRPYGLLEVAGYLRGRAEFTLFDHLDRQHEFMAGRDECKSEKWGRGRFYEKKTSRPDCLSGIPRYFKRFGLPEEIFQKLLQQRQFDYIFIQTLLTYWYPGVVEVIKNLKRYQANAKIILGGVYATLCPDHAATLGADLIVSGSNFQPLWDYLKIEPDMDQPALWEAYPKIETAAVKITDGCPFQCTYCSVPKMYGGFSVRPRQRIIKECELLAELGVEHIAFYDDALLHKSDDVLIPFLDELKDRRLNFNFHTPNAVNARFVTKELARKMVGFGIKTFYIGFESGSYHWQKQTGSKVFSDELAGAVEYLKSAGAEPDDITAYQILGHPAIDIQEMEESMRFVNSLGIRGVLADFSPIPGTPDGDACGEWVDLSEPLMHNKTAFTIIRMGFDESNRLKDLQRSLNRQLGE